MRRVTGGASFPAALGLITVTWPLAVAWADEDGVCIDLRFGFMKRLPGHWAGPGPGRPSWSARWGAISSVDVAPRSFVVYVSGGHGCRFVVLRRRKLAPLTRRFEAQELAVQHVRGTICWLFTQD